MHASAALAISCLALCALPAAARGQTATGGLAGTVIDHDGGKPVAGARITLRTLERAAETNNRGAFELKQVAAGTHEIVIERIGYESRTVTVAVEAQGILDVRIALSKKPIELPAISVTTRSTWLADAGFYDRRDTGGLNGHFITRADIARRQPRGMTDLFEDVPGVRLLYMEVGRRIIRFNRQVSPDAAAGRRPMPALERAANPLDARGCEPDLYVDGVLYRNAVPRGVAGSRLTSDDTPLNKVDNYDAVPVTAIEAMEVYVGANTPVQYRSPCGVILVWTRRGR